MDINLKKLICFLPFAFLLHNIEEALTINPNTYLHSRLQFIIAVILFTILGFVIVFKNCKWHNYLVTGFSGMLFLNAFFPHILSFVYLKNYTPGLFTATLLILPLTSIILYSTYKSKILSEKQFTISIVLGAIMGIILLFTFLTTGYIVSVLYSLNNLHSLP